MLPYSEAYVPSALDEDMHMYKKEYLSLGYSSLLQVANESQLTLTAPPDPSTVNSYKGGKISYTEEESVRERIELLKQKKERYTYRGVRERDRDRQVSETVCQRQVRLEQLTTNQQRRLENKTTGLRESRLQQLTAKQQRRLENETAGERESRLQQFTTNQQREGWRTRLQGRESQACNNPPLTSREGWRVRLQRRESHACSKSPLTTREG